MTVRVTVGAKVDVKVVDRDHIDLRSNAPWRLIAVSSGGTVALEGESTSSAPQRVTLPAGTLHYWVAPR